MSRVYAKFQICLMVLFTALVLSGCAGGYMSPWGSTNTGVMTNDPNSLPNIGWQTQGQRQDLPTAPPSSETPAAPSADVAKEDVPAPARHEKVKVALLLPLSGGKSGLGQSMLKAAQMALYDIASPNLELIPHDTKGTPDGAAAAAEAALNEHASLILGPIFAEDLKAVKPIANPAGIPVISFTTDWTLAGNNTYIMGFLPFTQVLRVTKYAQEHGYSRLAVYAPQTEYCDVVIRTLDKSGVSVVRASRYTPAPDLSTGTDSFAAAGQSGDGFDFDSLMLPLGSEGLRSLVTSLNKSGISQKNVKFLGTGLWDDPTLLNTPALYGGWFSAPDPRLRADFERRYQENYGSAPMRLSSLAYDATALAAVLARTSDSSIPFTAESITNPRGFAGIDGIFRFRSDGLSERGLAVLEIRAGKAKVVDPAPTAFIAGS